MPIYVQCCTACGHTFEDVRTVSKIDPNPPCRECDSPTERTFAPATNTGYADAIVVYQAPDGTMRFPGAKDGRTVAEYNAAGYARHEIRSAAEMRRFEGQMNRHEKSIMARKLERKQAAREQRESELRSELRSRMQSMSTFGRDAARAAMRHNDSKPRERTADPNFHSEVYSFDRSNRDESRSSDGKRHRD